MKGELEKEITDNMKISWAAFHASQQESHRQSPVDISSLLPLFKEEAKSAAMIRHSLDVIQSALAHLNPGQIPVVAFDQPLYAIAKQIQWQWSNSHGEKHYVIMFGGLHVEMTALKAIGKWLEDSGWTSALIQSGVASPGKADSFLKASHVSRTRHVHQVTASVLHMLMYDAYKKYCKDMNAEDVPLEFDKWRLQQEEARPQFLYWSITLRFELIILIFIKSLRERNFKLYIDALVSLMPWFFCVKPHKLCTLVACSHKGHDFIGGKPSSCFCRIYEWKFCHAKDTTQFFFNSHRPCT